LLTIFTVPKPFAGHINVIQRNAIQSWSRLRPACEIILCGNETGTEGTAAEFNAKHLPKVDRNEYDTPLLNSVFARVQEIATYKLICYVNADIILLSDLIDAVQRIRFPNFVAVGQRWDIDLSGPWNFEQSNWEKNLRNHAAEFGVLHPPSGSDYFVFPRASAMGKLPPFAVGRPGWDNWFIYKARKLHIPVIDLTKVVTVIHQNHPYGHVPEGSDQKGWEGPEAERNRELMGGSDYEFTLTDATHLLTRRMLLPALNRTYLRRRWQTLPSMNPRLSAMVQRVRELRKVIAAGLRFPARLVRRR
jgi:hypothetical protein